MRPAWARAIALMAFMAASPALHAQAACSGPLGLVLSGGGAKGLAHIGVLRVMDSLGIRPDLVVGTSMGSIIGAMYASGYSGEEIEATARELNLAELFSGELRTPRSLGQRHALVVWEPRAGGFRPADAGAREAEVNAALNRILLRGNLLARGDFDSLPIPFRAIATDIRTREEVVLSGGDLARAVRASMAIPLIFQAERIDGRDLVDGGLAANVPVGTARQAGATHLIVSDVSWRPPDSIRTGNPLAVADLLVAYLFTQRLDSLGPNDRLVRAAVDSFRTLDFSPEKVDTIIARGYLAARSAFAAHPPCGAAAPAPARAPHPAYRLRRVRFSGLRAGDERLLLRHLGLVESDTLRVGVLRQRLASMRDMDEYREVWLRPSGPPDSLTLSPVVRVAPAVAAFAGLAYDNDLGGQMWVGGVDRGTVIPGLETALTLGLAELRQEFGVGFRRSSLGRYLRLPFLTASIAREEIRQFTPDGDVIQPIRGTLGIERRFGRDWWVAVGGIAHAWDAPGSTRTNALGGIAQVSSGPRYRASGIWGEAELTNAYRRVEVEARQVVPLAGFRISPIIRFGWGKDLPLNSTFALGGTDGFPGLNIGELRGDRELLAELLIVRRLFGPINLRLTAASGQTATGGPTLARGRWQAGGRLGFGAETPIGPIRVEYGLARDDRNGFFVRLGEWF
jgi:NTE family protein